MSVKLLDKVCVVTGAGSGIGRATAIEMAACGAKVVVSDQNELTGRATTGVIADSGGRAEFVQADVGSGDDITRLMDRAAALFGGIDVLHNNAGIHETSLTGETSSETLREDVWDRVMDINLKGTWRCSKAAFPYLRGGGSIINSASIVSFVAYPMGPAYCASKAAIVALTKSLATDWGQYGIRVNCCAPSAIETEFLSGYWESAPDPEAVKRQLVSSHLIKRLGTAQDVAKVVCFLASDDASFVTGSVYAVDGGVLAWRGAD